jgi:hypothetical protein
MLFHSRPHFEPKSFFADCKMNHYCELVSDKQAGAVATPSTIQDKMAASSYWYLKLAASETTATVTCIPRPFFTSRTFPLTIKKTSL